METASATGPGTEPMNMMIKPVIRVQLPIMEYSRRSVMFPVTLGELEMQEDEFYIIKISMSRG
jgi:hypothetical protein